MVRGYLSLTRKDCVTHRLAIHINFLLYETIPLTTPMILFFDWLYLIQCFICTKFLDAFSSRVDTVVSVSQSASDSVFGSFNVQRKDWWTYPSRTDSHGDFTQVVNFPPLLLRSLTAKLLVFLFEFIYNFWKQPLFCCGFRQLGNSDPDVVSVSTDILISSKGMLLFIAQFLTLLILIGTVFVIFNLDDSVATTELCQWVQIGSDEYFPVTRIWSGLVHRHGFQLLDAAFAHKKVFLL